MQLLNLSREFKLLKMKEIEKIKDYSARLLKLVNQIRILRSDLLDSNIVQKILVSILKRFKLKISSLEDSRDLTKISLVEPVNAL